MIMRYFIKSQSVPRVESMNADLLNLIRMPLLKPKTTPTPIPQRISQRKLKAIRLEEQAAPITGPASGRYCMIPPPPTPVEAGALLSLEFQMLNLPQLQSVVVDDIEALAMVNSVTVTSALEAQTESGAFDEEEPKSSTDARTIVPR